jgi:hypothetical protein
MAPNLRPLNFMTAGADSSVPRVNLKLAQQQQPLPQSQSVEQVSASYWDWSAPVDVLSLAHLEAKLVQQANILSTCDDDDEPSHLVAEHDDYWAEASAASPTLLPLHAAAAADENYWNEECYEPSASDAYWTGATHAPSSADTYWSNDSHAPTASDVYWHGDRAAGAASDAYWKESHELTAADRYWSTATL